VVPLRAPDPEADKDSESQQAGVKAKSKAKAKPKAGAKASKSKSKPGPAKSKGKSKGKGKGIEDDDDPVQGTDGWGLPLIMATAHAWDEHTTREQAHRGSAPVTMQEDQDEPSTSSTEDVEDEVL